MARKSSKPGNAAKVSPTSQAEQPQLVIISGLSGSGKATVLKALEDSGYYSVDNLPLELIPKFAELTHESPSIRRAALVVDVREGDNLQRFPEIFAEIRQLVPTRLLFLDADDETLMRRFSETRRPHPLGGKEGVLRDLRLERKRLAPVRVLADHVLQTAELNVHQLRRKVIELFGESERTSLRVYVVSFGFRNGVPAESDLVFDVRFLPNPNYIPQFKPYSGKNPRVARFIRSFPRTREFIDRVNSLLLFLMPFYREEGKTYLTISFGCTGGRHRSVMMAEDVGKRLKKAGYAVQVQHRDIDKQ